MREPGLYATRHGANRAALEEWATGLGVALPEGASDAPQNLELVLDAVDPGGSGAMYRFGDQWLVVVALNAEGSVEDEWARMLSRVPGVASACFATADAAPNPDWVDVGWGWVRGDCTRLQALSRAEYEPEAHRFLSTTWPVAVEFLRQATAAVDAGREASARLAQRISDLRALAEAHETLRVLSQNVGRLGAVHHPSVFGSLFGSEVRGWSAARAEWSATPTQAGGHPAEGLPYPVAGAIRSRRRLADAHDRLQKGLDCVESTLALGAAIVTARARWEGVPADPVSWGRPSFGSWASIAESVLSTARWSDPEPLFQSASWRRARALAERVAAIRNREQGHGALRLDERVYLDLAPQVESLFGELIDALGGFDGVQLGWVRRAIRRRAAVPKARVAWLSGSNPYFEEEELDVPEEVALDGEVFCRWGEMTIPLHPFVAVEDVGGLLFVGVLAGVGERRARYLCRVTGEQRSLPADAWLRGLPIPRTAE